MRKDKTEMMLNKWLNILKINDWSIVLKPDCSPFEFKLSNSCGECEYDEVNKAAVIRIVSEADYGERTIPYNFEKILVHELLHIKFCLLYNSDCELQNRLTHQLIEDMARSLVDANVEGRCSGKDE